MPSTVEIVEVGPRDGLQARPDFVATRDKIALIDRLAAAGLRHFEASSFVSPRAVPQLADAAEVLAGVTRHDGMTLSVLVPNLRGAEAAIAARADALVMFASASETHNLKNVNRSRADSLAGFRDIAEVARTRGVPLHGAIATAFGCPFEGEVPVSEVVRIACYYADLGVRRITLGDTTGMATPRLVRERVRALRTQLLDLPVALHFHNTRGMALVNVAAGLEAGAAHFESAIGGLGGCPFAPGATGNLCTEDLVHFLHEEGIETGLDLDALIETARWFEGVLGAPLPGQVVRAGPRLARRGTDEVATATG